MVCIYGMVWYGMVWYGMVWYGMVWYGMVWYSMVWYGMVRYIHLVATLPNGKHYGVSTRTGQPSASVQWLDDMASLIFRVPAHDTLSQSISEIPLHGAGITSNPKTLFNSYRFSTLSLKWMPMWHRSSNPQPHPAVLSHLWCSERPDMTQSGGCSQEAPGTSEDTAADCKLVT